MTNRPETRFEIGDRVRHAEFGAGQVQATQRHHDGQICTILFEKAGVKQLIPDLCRLESDPYAPPPPYILLWPTRASWGRIVARSQQFGLFADTGSN